MNIILFGPPGIGKSTIIGDLKLSFAKAIDLEDVYPSSIRFQLPSMVDGVVFGGADLNPARLYHNAIKILLWTDQKVYDARRRMRDAIESGKKSQSHHNIDDWVRMYDRNGYAATLDVTNPLTQDMLILLRQICLLNHPSEIFPLVDAYQRNSKHSCEIFLANWLYPKEGGN